METELWAASLNRELTRQEQDALLFFLPPERRERLLRGKSSAQRQEVLCAYGLLRFLLLEKLGWKTLPEVGLMAYGKPWFPAYPRVQFNLSHTAGAVLVGLSEEPIGVDIEKIRPVSERMMRHTFGVQNQEEFFRRWVLLEATGKRSGRGLVSLHPGSGQAEDDCRNLDLLPGYAAGVALSPGCFLEAANIFTM